MTLALRFGLATMGLIGIWFGLPLAWVPLGAAALSLFASDLSATEIERADRLLMRVGFRVAQLAVNIGTVLMLTSIPLLGWWFWR
ncbi:MAG: hypothetical protein IPM06_21140 [Rhizobiales bacterium]|nr:hypothetical protein [Hyphomicrobiales bacterium]